ncbi:S8 family serine peptidase [Luteimonas sp. RD2P54]|uniref:S8 family serine peptidase n=1 Tax=Luteimonas endophytica TaxID=3042023 RepID=A0ABT6JDD4_9GAMM|nr:S8 family serine peptidase [Luteimonas endophytica]MDH5824213.1 S8 family serine peptidase [Luteimonas endophytica]
MSSANQDPRHDLRHAQKIVVRVSPQMKAAAFLLNSKTASPIAPWNLEAYLPSAHTLGLMQDNGEKRISSAQSRLTRYYSVDVPSEVDIEEALLALEALPEVETAYIAPGPHDPPAVPADDPLSSRQRYLNPAKIGIDAHFAWSMTNGAGVGFVDLEQGWILDHEDLEKSSIETISGLNHTFHGHGTAVLGQICATDNDRGCIGIAPGCKTRVVSEWRDHKGNFNTADAIASATASMQSGDVLLIEAQTDYGPFINVPVEVYDAAFDAIRAASDAGVIVVEAAGNGGIDLDKITNKRGQHPLSKGAAGFRDSGAILVGAASSSMPRRRSSFSNYGSRVDCFGWGDSVVTCGDGWLGRSRTEYTAVFNGTSAASPLVAGAALLVQAWSKAARGVLIAPYDMRALLSNAKLNTSTDRPAVDRVGVMPDLQRILDELKK